MSDAICAIPNNLGAQSNADKSQLARLILCGLAALSVLLFATNWTLPWEGDQPAKAAQIIEIAQTNDYCLSSSVVDHYKVRLFSFYYAVSALLYEVIGGDIFAFMNITSVAMGVVFVVTLANSNWRLFRIHPLWTTFVLLAVPAVVTTFTYGNEVAWSLSLLTLSLMLATYPQPVLYYSTGVAFAAAVFCRVDLVLIVPFWLVWVVWVARQREPDPLSRLVKVSVFAACSGAILWSLFLRTIPVTNSDIRWADSIKFILAMLVYPFNPSVVLLAAPAWLWFRKNYSLAAWTLVLLLLQVVYYIGVLASPKYIMPLLLAYGLVVPFMLDRLSWIGRAAIVAAIAFWFFFAISIYGFFGPRAGSRWYLPTVDGPCPTGSYLSFYQNARLGRYQLKQQEFIDVTHVLFDYLNNHPDAPTLFAYRPLTAYGFVAQQKDYDIPVQATREVTEDEDRFLMIRPAYFNVARFDQEQRDAFDRWLEQGRVRGVGHDSEAALPTLVEIGGGIPVGENYNLGKRILFMDKRFQGHMVHEIPVFISEYRSITWLPTIHVPKESKTVYRDASFSAVEGSVEGGKIYGFVWPAIYYGQRHPRDY